MPPSPDDQDGGIRWQTEDAADALLSDIMSEVSQDADAEKEALAAERRAREEEERQKREADEHRQNTEIEQRLRDEEARRAAADEERRRLMREAELAQAVARGEIDEEEARRLAAPEDTHEELDATVDSAGVAARADQTQQEPTFDQAAPAPVVAPQPQIIHAKAPPPETRWGVTLMMVIPLLLVSAGLGFVLFKEKASREVVQSRLTKATTEAATVAQKNEALTRKLTDEKERYRKLERQLTAMATAKSDPPKEAARSSKGGGRTRSRAKASGSRKSGDAGGGGTEASTKKKKKKKKKGGRKFDLGESIFEGSKDGKIVF